MMGKFHLFPLEKKKKIKMKQNKQIDKNTKSSKFILKPLLNLQFYATQKNIMQIKLFSLLLLNMVWT